MDIMQIASNLLENYFGNEVPTDSIQTALSGLLGDGEGGIDIAGIVGQLNEGGGMASIVGSWLGDGGNEGISAQQIMSAFGGDKISQFASNLGVSQDQAADGLSSVLPQIVDQASSGGNLLDSVGGIGGALNMAKSLF